MPIYRPIKPEAVIQVRFLTTREGGRKSSIESSHYGYSCPIMVNECGYDCRFLLAGECFELGKVYEIPVKFLNPNIALKELKDGTEISLWEGKTIATGKILKIFG